MVPRRWLTFVASVLLALPAVAAPVPAVAQARTTWNLPADFSGVQGQDGWTYLQGSPGGYVPLEFDTTVAPWPDRATPSWNGGPRFLQIAGPPDPFIQTGEGQDTAVAWTAPRAGRVTVTGTMAATSTSTTYESWCGPECDDGISFSILLGTEVKAGPVRVLHGDPTDQSQTLTATFDVAAGDSVFFAQARGRWQDADAATYDFTVTYAGGGTGTGTSTPPGLTEVGSGIVPLGRSGTTDFALDADTGLIKVWAHAYSDIVDQWQLWNVINLDQSWIKVMDYRVVEATGVTGARYDADLTITGRLAGIVDRLDYTLPVGGSATKYRTQLVVGVAETGSYRDIDTANGARAVVWDAENNLWVDLAWDVGEAVVGAAIGEWAASGVPETWLAFALARALDVNLTLIPIAYDLIGADEEVNETFQVTLDNLRFQAGKRYVVYVYLSGAVSAASTGIAAGTCELDFWHHAPHITDTAGSDPMGGRGFRLTGFSPAWHAVTYDPPATPAGPVPADGSLVDLSDRKEGTYPLRGVTLGWDDPRGGGYPWKWHVYWGTTFPLQDLGQTYAPSMWTGQFAEPNTTYHWKLVAEGYGGRTTEGPLWSYRTNDFNRDPVMGIRSPSDGATGFPRQGMLQWRATDPNGQDLRWEVYLGTDDPPTALAGIGSMRSGDLVQFDTPPLAADTPYHWFVRLTDGHDGRTDSTVFDFTTGDAAPVLSDPTPGDGASGVAARMQPSIRVVDADGDPVTLEIKVGPSAGTLTSLATMTATGDTAMGVRATFSIPELTRGTRHYWQVVADDGHGGLTTSPVWWFNLAHNSVPARPVVQGPTGHATGVSTGARLSWSASVDPDGDAVVYDVYLGDQGVLDIPLVASGLPNPWYDPGGLIANHTYTWKVVARDAYGGSSESYPVAWFTTGAS